MVYFRWSTLSKIRFLKEFYSLKEVSTPVTLSENPEKGLSKLEEVANEGYQREQKLWNRDDGGCQNYE